MNAQSVESTPSSRAGMTLAIIGALWQVLPVGMMVSATSEIAGALPKLSSEGVGDPAMLGAAIGELIIAVNVGVIWAVPGVAMLIIAIMAEGYRSRWLYGFLVPYSVLLLPAVPLGSAAGIFFLAYYPAKHQQFFRQLHTA